MKMEAYHDGDYWCARGIGADVFTQGKTFEELLENVKEAGTPHFGEEVSPTNGDSILVLTETGVGNVFRTPTG